MTYDEFNGLQKQQMIRDTAQSAWYKLNALVDLGKRKDRDKLLDCMKLIKDIEFEAIKEIRNMIDGGNYE